MPKFARIISIDGFTFNVESQVELSEDQARQSAFHFCRQHRLTEENRAGVILVISKLDENTREYF